MSASWVYVLPLESAQLTVVADGSIAKVTMIVFPTVVVAVDVVMSVVPPLVSFEFVPTFCTNPAAANAGLAASVATIARARAMPRRDRRLSSSREVRSVREKRSSKWPISKILGSRDLPSVTTVDRQRSDALPRDLARQEI